VTPASDSSDPGVAETSRGVDIAAGLFLAALSIFALVWLIPANTQPVGRQFDVAPGFFPNIAASAVLILSIVMVIDRWRRRRTEVGGPGIVAELMVWAGACVVVMLALSSVGFVPMASLLLVAAMVFSGNRNWWLIAAMAVAFPLAIDWAAWLIFTVDLP
jgi:hypothetical protein